MSSAGGPAAGCLFSKLIDKINSDVYVSKYPPKWGLVSVMQTQAWIVARTPTTP